MDKQEIESCLNYLYQINVDKIYIFTDTRLNISDSRIITYRKDVRLRWSQIFDWILNNKFINEKGCYLLEPGNVLDNNVENDFHIFTGGVYVKNLKKNINVNRFIFNDYEFLRLNVYGTKFKVASICHIYYEDLLEEITDKLNNLKNTDLNVDYYFSLTENSSTNIQKEWVKNYLNNKFPGCKIYILPNKGLDIGAFFKVIEDIYHLKYDFLIKTHTKKSLKTSGKYFGNMWRNNLLSMLDNIPVAIKHMEAGEYMMGSRKWIIPVKNDNLNSNLIENVKKDLNIEHGDQFIGGTMFFINFFILKKYFTLNKIKEYYDKMEENYIFQTNSNDSEYYTHTLERIFGIIIGNENKRIKGL
jgi:hypothetical protein